MVSDVIYLPDLDEPSSDPRLKRALADARAPFERAEWFGLLARHGGMTPLYLLATGDEEAALLALAERDGVIRPLANWYSFRWRPLVSEGADRADLLAKAARALPRRGWQIALDQVPDEDGSATALEQALRGAGWIVRREAHDKNHVLPVHGRSFAQFLAERPGALRTTLKRKTAKVSCTLFHDFQNDAWDSYEEIYVASWKPEEGNPALLRAFAEAEGAAGRLRMGLATVDGRAVAAQFWTVEQDTAFIHKLAHREDGKTHSPGTVLSAALFEQAIDRDGVSLIDFGTGDNPYKRDWMDDIRPRYRIDALWPRAPRAWPHIARLLARRLLAR
jgi:hypothetical protein